MNVYTFTAKEIELLTELIATADDTDQDKLAVLSSLSDKLNRKHKHMAGEHTMSELNLSQESELNYSNARNKIAKQELEKNEALLKQALDSHLVDWSLSSIHGRMRSENHHSGITVYFLDDKPILELRNTKSRVSMASTSTEFTSNTFYKFL